MPRTACPVNASHGPNRLNNPEFFPAPALQEPHGCETPTALRGARLRSSSKPRSPAIATLYSDTHLRTPHKSLDAPAPIDTGFCRFAILIVAALTAARVISLVFNRTDLFVDESQYWSWSQALDWGYYSKPPLIALLIAATTSVFGNAEWAVRLSAPLLHGGTSLLLMALGNRLYGGRAGGLSAILFATLPAVALSSALISTDVPLLFAWAAALIAAVRLIDRDDWGSAFLLGAAIAVGVNAKYAMAFFPAVLVLAIATASPLRNRLASPRLWSGIAIGALGFIPNLIWNAQHAYVTFRHTGDNTGWAEAKLQPLSMLEFFGGQFGVFGPILFLMLLVTLAGRLRTDRPGTDRFLLSLSVPIIAALLVQSLASDANANWAATAYPAATVLVSALLANPARKLWLRGTLTIHGVAVAAMLIAPAFAPVLKLPMIGRPFERVLGWQDFAEKLGATATAAGAQTIVLDRRADIAASLYYLRSTDFTFAVVASRSGIPANHFQLTRPFTPSLPSPGMLAIEPNDDPANPNWRVSGPPTLIPVSRAVHRRGTMAAVPIDW